MDTDLNHNTKSTLAFRHDINGLRAWAVLAVTFYHFGIPFFGGGFIGVDLFFVISGYLMTGIIVNRLENNNGEFALFPFYLARARRIMPALIALCAVLLTAGWLALPGSDYETLAFQIVAALTFLSNITFWREAGYFDISSHEKWLLHTWSLSVEWQFYLLLPVTIVVLWKIKPQRQFITIIISLALLLSLALSIFLTPIKPGASFYLLTTRAWEMLAGSLVFLLNTHLKASAHLLKMIEIAGFALIIISITSFNSSTKWPGWQATIPVAGAVFILLSAQQNSFLSNNSITQWLGTRSYSIYLWHWPIAVALTYLQKQNSVEMLTAGLLLTLFISLFSYAFIEERTGRSLGKMTNSKGAIYLASITAILTTSSLLVVMNNGFVNRMNEHVQLADTERTNIDPRRDECHIEPGEEFKYCIYGGNSIEGILIGDSHAAAIVTAIASSLPHENSGLLAMSYSGCPTLLGIISGESDTKCNSFNEWAMEKIQKLPSHIPLIIINRTTAALMGVNEYNPNLLPGRPTIHFTKQYTTIEPEFINEFQEHLIHTACQYANNRTVYMLRPIPEMGIDVPKTIARSAITFQDIPEIFITTTTYHQRHALTWAAQDEAAKRCGVKILDPLPILCPNEKCSGTKNNRPIYYDDDILSEYGNRSLISLFSTIFETDNKIPHVETNSSTILTSEKNE